MNTPVSSSERSWVDLTTCVCATPARSAKPLQITEWDKGSDTFLILSFVLLSSMVALIFMKKPHVTGGAHYGQADFYAAYTATLLWVFKGLEMDSHMCFRIVLR